MSENFVVKLKKRPWYEWILWLLWLALLIFMAQNASASSAELESRAALIFWISFVVWLLAGSVVWFIRRSR